MVAAGKGQEALVKTLLERGATVDQATTVGFVKCDLSLSIITFSIGCLSAGANRLKITRHFRFFLRWDLQSGMTALMLAVVKGHDGVVQTLLERGAAVSQLSKVRFVK